MLTSSSKLVQIKRSIVVLETELEKLRILVHELETEIKNGEPSPKGNTRRRSHKHSSNTRSSAFKLKRAQALGKARAWAKETYGDKCH